MKWDRPIIIILPIAEYDLDEHLNPDACLPNSTQPRLHIRVIWGCFKNVNILRDPDLIFNIVW